MSIVASASNITATTAQINVSGLSSLGSAPAEGFQVILYRTDTLGGTIIESVTRTFIYNPFADSLFFNIGGLQPSTTYFYFVLVRDEQFETEAGRSNNFSLTTAEAAIQKTLQVVSAREVNARYENPSGAAGFYQLYRATSAAALNDVSTLTPVATSAFISNGGFYILADTSAPPNSTLWYKVVRREGTVNGVIRAQSVAQSVTTPAETVAVPNAPTGAAFSGNTLSWSHDGLRLDDFLIEVETISGGWQNFSVRPAADRSVLIQATEFSRNFRIFARNATGRSASSNVATQPPAAPPVGRFVLGNITFNSPANQVTITGSIVGLAAGVTARIQITRQQDTSFTSAVSSSFQGNGDISFSASVVPTSIMLYRVITNTGVVLASGQEIATPQGGTTTDDDYYITRFDVVKKSFALLVVGQVLPAGGLVDGAISTPTDETLTSKIIVDDGTTATPIGSFNFARYGLTHEVRRERIEMGQLGVQFLHSILLKGTLTKALPKLRYFVPED